MMAGVHENAIVGGMVVGPAEHLLAFAARLRWLHTRRAATSAAVRSLLLLAVPAIVVAWLVPPWLVPAGVVLASFVLGCAAVAAVAARRVGDAALLRATDRARGSTLDVVGDELATWLECHRRAVADAPMARWLGQEVAAQLPGLRNETLAHVGHRGLGRWRRLLPFVLLMLLAWLLTEWLAPPWPGVLGGRATIEVPSTGTGSGAKGSGGQAPQPGGAPQPTTPEQPTAAQPEHSPPPPPLPPPPSDRPELPPPEAPAPLLNLPEQQRFLVPEFVGDGPTRRVRMHAAELERAGPAPKTSATPSGAGGDMPPPGRSREEFERAAEAALRSRHVPPEERPMVRRFFELLRQAAR